MIKYSISGWKIMVSVFLMALLTVPLASAEKKIFHGTGEYTMSDYETPEVAKQRAIAYAKQRAAEQAGVYVETYSRMNNMQITEDKVGVLVNSAMLIIEQNTEMQQLPTGDVRIVGKITAEIDTDTIKERNSNQDIDMLRMKEMYTYLSVENKKDEKEIARLKNEIKEMKSKELSTKDLQIEVKVKEQFFLANQKLNEASTLYYKNEYDNSMKIVNDVLRLNPKNEWGYVLRGDLFEKNKEYNKAINDYTNAINIDPESGAALSAYLGRGVLCYRKGEYDKVIMDFSRVLSMMPINNYSRELVFYVYCVRADLYYDRGEYEKAIDDYTKAIDINNKDAEVFKCRAVAYFAKEEYDKALDDYTKSITVNNKYAASYIGRAHIYNCKGEYDNAIKDCEQFIKYKGESSIKMDVPYTLLGIAYFGKIDYERAITYLEKAIEINPNNKAAKEVLEIVSKK
ncbi:tetratricopeptide repeat protein [Selenomonas ruminantium]|uniref:Tetratricopeptide repeat-containing protein n=1 Tax=Selenomonas ruminantium TaxID=971 RepID=A0A1H3VIM3_SELRU|nr:tetratricopeptide repeat protein [Selenomonas ruminantium]SDZ74094.1 Tetratricopeptide repeat-containing protein [Selenomonas ruminantium]